MKVTPRSTLRVKAIPNNLEANQGDLNQFLSHLNYDILDWFHLQVSKK